MVVRAILAVLGFLVLTTVNAQAQNLVTNPGFESGLTGWTSGGVNWVAGNSPTSAPRSGAVQAYSRCGNSGQTCTLSQTIAITPGRYTFSVYAISPVSAANTATSNFTATVGGQTLYSGTFQQPTGLNTDQTGYQFISGNFTLDANSTTIFFSGFNSSGDLAIDDVSLVRIGNAPEPATWLLMILGFGVVGTTLRRRRRVSATCAALVAA